MTQTAEETRTDEQPTNEVSDTPKALKEVMAKYGASFDDGPPVLDADPAPEPAEDKDGKDKVADGDKPTRTEDEPTLPTWTKEQTAAIEGLKISDDTLAKMTPDEAEAFVNRLVKIRKDAAKVVAGKDKPDPKEDATEERPSAEVEESGEFTDDHWGDEKGLSYINRLEKRLEALEATAQERETQATYATVDRFLSRQTTDIRKLFGDKPIAELEDDTPELDAALALSKRAARLRKGAIEDGEEMTEDEALDEALAIVAKEALKKAAERNTTRRLRHEQTTPRPSADRGGSPSIGNEDAASAMQSVARKYGVVLPHG